MDLDDPTIPTCPRCGALPEVATGVTATVRFTADGNATITADLSDLDTAALNGEWQFACPESCEEVQGDTEAWAEAAHEIEALLEDVAANCAPSLDYTIGSGGNRG